MRRLSSSASTGWPRHDPLCVVGMHSTASHLLWDHSRDAVERVSTRRSKIKLQTCRERSMARQFGVKIQWIEPVVLIRQVQQPDGKFSLSSRETIASEEIELPEVISGECGRVIVIALVRPYSLSP